MQSEKPIRLFQKWVVRKFKDPPMPKTPMTNKNLALNFMKMQKIKL
jgi:hypothetical protein